MADKLAAGDFKRLKLQSGIVKTAQKLPYATTK